MKIRTLVLIALPLCSALSTYAQWQKFDDFESGKLLQADGGKWIFAASDLGKDVKPDSKCVIVLDPDPAGAAKGNHVMRSFAGTPAESDHRSRLIGRPAPINYKTTGTAYYRWYTKTVNIKGTEFAPEIDMNVGMSAVDIPTEYSHSGPVTGYDVGEAQFRAYNGDPDPANPSSVIGFQNMLVNRPNNVWVSQWFYIRNLSVAKQQQDYQVYYRVGSTGTPILGYPFEAGEFAGFRAKPDGDLDPKNAHLDVFYFTNTSGNIAVPQALDAEFYADDVYIDQNGINLSDPVGSTAVSTPPPAATGTRISNLSSRLEISTAGAKGAMGFAVSGTSAKKLLIRASGPTLTADFGLPGYLAAPVLTLTTDSGKTMVGTNTRWGTAANASDIPAAAASSGAFAYKAGSADSVLLVTLQPGTYSAEISGVGTGTGAIIAELYEVP